MAAPSSVYQTYKTRRRKAGTPDVDVDLYIAKFLQNTTPQSGDAWGDGYFNSTDTEAQKIAKIKDIFKIDGWNQADYAQQKTGTITISGTSVTGTGTAFTTDFVVGQKLGALVLTDGVLKCVETYVITAITSATAMSVVAGTNRTGISYALYHQGFIGYCNSRNSGNGLYHKTERFSGVRVPTTAQASAELLNDGGLNRKGELEISQPLPDNEPKYANWINLTLLGRSAFYNATDDIGISYKINSGSWTDILFTETYSVKQIISRFLRGINSRGGGDEDISLPSGFSEGDTITFRAIIKNGEGTMYGDEYSFIAEEKIASLIAWKVDSPSGSIILDTIAFTTEDNQAALASVTTTQSATGIYVYANEYFISSEKLDSGWWVFNDYPDKAFWVDSNGQVTYYNTRTTSTPYIRLAVMYAGTRDFPDLWRFAAACVDSTTGFPNTITIATETRYYTYSGGIYTEVGTPETININLVSGEFSAEGRYIMRPSGATHSRTTTSTSGIGLTVESPYVLITL